MNRRQFVRVAGASESQMFDISPLLDLGSTMARMKTAGIWVECQAMTVSTPDSHQG